jgi:hypothetical protein
VASLLVRITPALLALAPTLLPAPPKLGQSCRRRLSED